MAHTPGPWIETGDSNWHPDCYDGDSSALWTVLRSDSADIDVAIVMAYPGSAMEAIVDANARLIAAAPDMFEACIPLEAKLTQAEASFGAAEHAIGGPLKDEDGVTISIGLLRAVRAALARAQSPAPLQQGMST
jgi:hypothetical protein